MKGFTLVELLITVAVLAAVAAVAGINLFGYYSRQNLELTTEEFIALIRDAQNRSLTQQDGNADGQGDQWGIHFENAATTQDFGRLFFGSSYASSTAAATNILRTGIQFTDPGPGTSKDVIFSKVTGLPDVSVTVIISLTGDSSASSTIYINENGRIQY